VVAEPREILGKKVSSLRRQGLLPGVVYGHGHKPQPIQLVARDLEGLMRVAGRNTLVDLKVGGRKALPVLLQGVHEHPVRRHPLHVDFYVVKMTEEHAVDVPVHLVGSSVAAERMGGTLLHLREMVHIRALPADLPAALDLDISRLEDFDAVLHVRDLDVPHGVTVVTDPDEPLARVQPPRHEEELRAPVAEEAEGAEAAEAAAGESETAGEASDA
jgi:large subunit ribosomal protein L25